MQKLLRSIVSHATSESQVPRKFPIENSSDLTNKELWQTSRLVKGAIFSYVKPEPAPLPAPLAVSSSAAAEIKWQNSAADFLLAETVSLFSGRLVADGTVPWASNYSGYQFGTFAGQLGDGRAISLFLCPGQRGYWEVQLKGAGRTPYSRFGDGYATLFASIREYLCSEYLASLGVPTTRALALLATGRVVEREEGPEPGAIVVRMSPSWIRFGTFEGPFYRSLAAYEATKEFDFGELLLVKKLADHVVDLYYPSARRHSTAETMLALLQCVCDKTAELVACWQSTGFVHGVLNTDNMSVLGLTLDFGPFGFIERYDPDWTSNSTDIFGRYSLSNQPNACLWNLTQFSKTLLYWVGGGSESKTEPSDDVLKRLESAKARTAAVLETFRPTFERLYSDKMCRKLGLVNLEGQGLREAYSEHVAPLLVIMKLARADYTSMFRRLGTAVQMLDLHVADNSAWHLLRDSLTAAFRERELEKSRQKTLYEQRILDERELQKAVKQTKEEQLFESQFYGYPLDKQVEALREMWTKWALKLRQHHFDMYGEHGSQECLRVMRESNPKYLLRNSACQEVYNRIASKYFKSLSGDDETDSVDDTSWRQPFAAELEELWKQYPHKQFKELYGLPIQQAANVFIDDPYGLGDDEGDSEEVNKLKKRWDESVFYLDQCNVQCSCSS